MLEGRIYNFHHENEIAQSETLTEKPFANYWLHNGMLTIEDQKMSKLGEFLYGKRHSKGIRFRSIAFLLISAHYRNL